MTPPELGMIQFAGMVACLMTGYYLGFDWGKKCGLAKVMTRTQAAKIMAKASWTGRIRAGNQIGFFKTVNR